MKIQHLNECRIDLTLEVPENGRFIVAHHETQKKEDAFGHARDVMIPIHLGNRNYLPGSSIKGALRSRAEFIANVLNLNGVGACHLFTDKIDPSEISKDPFSRVEDIFCGSRFQVRVDANEPLTPSDFYKDACPACQLFGHTYMSSRVKVTDFILKGGQKRKETITHNQLNRLTMGVENPFTIEYFLKAEFYGQIIFENFSIWQLGWFGLLLQDIQDGIITFGSRKTTGSGRLNIRNIETTIRRIGTKQDSNEVLGVGELLKDKLKDSYGYNLLQNVDGIQFGNLNYVANFPWMEAALNLSQSLQLFDNAHSHTNDYLSNFKYAEGKMDAAAIVLAFNGAEVP